MKNWYYILKRYCCLVYIFFILSQIYGFELTSGNIPMTSNFSGGLIVYIGDDINAVTNLNKNNNFLIHALFNNPDPVTALRQQLIAKNLYGNISIDTWQNKKLPYVNNLVNIMVVDKTSAVSKEEIFRVLVPNGMAYIKREGSDNWEKIVKPWPRGMDEWPHYLHDSSGNPVARDDFVKPPEQLQWVSSPAWARHHEHMASMNALVSSQGKIFFICDEGPNVSMLHPPQWKLTARDSFNGLLLWQRPIDKWFPHLYPLKSGPASMPRRLVVDDKHVYVTLSIDGPVSILDNTTGKIIRTCKGTKGIQEIILFNKILFLVRGEKNTTYVTAVDSKTGEVLWNKKHLVGSLTLAANKKQVVFFTEQNVVGLDPQNGSLLWSSDNIHKQKIRANWIVKNPPRLILQDNAVIIGLVKWLFALDSNTGKQLWTAPYPRSGYVSPKDLFVIDGLVWYGDTGGAKNSGQFWGRDILTGEVIKTFVPDVDDIVWLSHHRCHMSKATHNYILTARMGVEFVDIHKQKWKENHWVRGGCLYGVMPANGLLYAPPHACACYFEVKINGFSALTSDVKQEEPIPDSNRLEKGPEYKKPLTKTSEQKEEWPTFRKNNARSGSSSTIVPTDIQKKWQISLNGKLTQPVVSNGRLYVAVKDMHSVWALNVKNGKKLWHYTAGGRVDSPPTIYRGRVIFGSRDGWIYCLNAINGKLAWRYRAFPYESLIMVNEQLESAWPVSGSVLIENSEVHCVAGRNMFLNGGLRYLRLNPVTGKKISESVMDRNDPIKGGTIQKYDSWLDMTTTLPDVLSSDGQNIYMRSLPFDMKGNRRRVTHIANESEPPHLFSPTGFLDDAWFHRSYWTYARIFPGGWVGHLNAGRYNPSGRLLIMDDNKIYGFGRQPQYYKWATSLEYRLFAVDKKTHKTRDIYAFDKFKNDQLVKFPSLKIDKLLGLPSGNKPKQIVRYKTEWENNILPILVRAMTASKNFIFIAGPKDVSDEGIFSFSEARKGVKKTDILTEAANKPGLKEQAEIWKGDKGAILMAVSKNNGKTIFEHKLDAIPVFDGMIAVDKQIFIATIKGTIICMGK